MSDLKPRGVPIVLDGVERHFLFTLNVIDEIQSRTKKTMNEVMEGLAQDGIIFDSLRDLVFVLVNDEVERDPGCGLQKITEQEAGWLVGTDNIMEVTAVILTAYGWSIPEPGEDDVPNTESGQQSR